MKNKLQQFQVLIWPCLIILVASLLFIGASPLYQTNPWDDSNAMLTMGRATINGLMPYQDIIEQRGPFLYSLYAVAAFISHNSFLGLYFVELVNLFLIYGITLKITQDMGVRNWTADWLALIGPIALLGTSAFRFGGAPEEFGFTTILYLLYVVIHYRQVVAHIPLKQFFWLGLNLSLLFWNKYSLVGAYAIFFIWVAVVLLVKKSIRRLFRVILAAVMGFLSISSLFFLYFVLRHAWGSLIQIYFVQNITAYGKSSASIGAAIWTTIQLMLKAMQLHPMVIVIIGLGWVIAIWKHQKIGLEIAMFFGTLTFVALQHWVLMYYNVIWMPFFALALIRIAITSHRQVVGLRSMMIATVVAISIFLMPIVNNADLEQLLFVGQQQSFDGQKFIAQKQFAKVIAQYSGHSKPSLLMINSIDKGFFLATQTIPQTLYWHRLNMTYQQLPQMYQNFNQSMQRQQIDFVIVRLGQMPAHQNLLLQQQIDGAIDWHLMAALWHQYHVVTTASNSPSEAYVLLAKNN